MADSRPTKRKPISEPMLVRHGKRWQVCYQARGTINYERVTAWVYGDESIFFCKVGDQNEIIMLPQKDMFFRGPFAFLVDRVSTDGVPLEILAGSANAGAAVEAYKYLKPLYSSGLRLMNGARLMLEQGKDENEQ